MQSRLQVFHAVVAHVQQVVPGLRQQSIRNRERDVRQPERHCRHESVAEVLTIVRAHAVHESGTRHLVVQ